MILFLKQLREALTVWYDNDGDHKAATISYYMVFAMAPLLLLSVAIHSAIFGRDFIATTLSSWGSVLGSDVIALLTDAVRNLEAMSDGFSIPVFGIIFFSFMVIMMFNNFTTGMHGIWGIRHRGFWGWLRKCKHSLAFVVIFEIYLFCMLTVVFVLSNFTTLPLGLAVVIDAIFFLVMTTLLFTLAFRVLPWQSPVLTSCVRGAFVASVLLYVARALVALYVAISPVPGIFGVAGLIIALLVWIFASAAVIYFGAAYAFVDGGRTLHSLRSKKA